MAEHNFIHCKIKLINYRACIQEFAEFKNVKITFIPFFADSGLAFTFGTSVIGENDQINKNIYYIFFASDMHLL